MATTTVINGVEVRVSETAKGNIYSKNFRSLQEEANAKGTTYAEINAEKHAFFLNGSAYYIGPSLQGLSVQEIAEKASQISVCDSSVDGKTWVPCLFLSKASTRIELQF